jgi:hypothetical protein
MSSRKVRKFTSVIELTSITQVSSNTYNVTTSAPHNLFVGDVIPTGTFAEQQYSNIKVLANSNGVVLVISVDSSAFGAPTPRLDLINGARIEVDWLANTSGPQAAFTLPVNAGGMIMLQSSISGNNAVSYNVESSLDSKVWGFVSTITHANVSGNSMFSTIATPWPYLRINVASLVGNTKLFVVGASV